MEGVLAARKDTVTGIINGIDPAEWDPATDPDIGARYDMKDLSGKKLNKEALQKENGFKVDPAIPLLGFVARLVDQKGLDILIQVLERLAGQQDVQLVLLGTGEDPYHQALRDIAKKNKKWFGVHIVFDPKMAKRIYAGADMLVIPSYYEPCGLGQIIALRYGTIPVVRATGGLADTVQNFETATQKGNGFIFEDYSSDALHGALLRAVKIFKQDKLWKELVKNAMKCDFSWNASAGKYGQLYEAVKRRPVKVEKT
jgi:starch synthase